MLHICSHFSLGITETLKCWCLICSTPNSPTETLFFLDAKPTRLICCHWIEWFCFSIYWDFLEGHQQQRGKAEVAKRQGLASKHIKHFYYKTGGGHTHDIIRIDLFACLPLQFPVIVAVVGPSLLLVMFKRISGAKAFDFLTGLSLNLLVTTRFDCLEFLFSSPRSIKYLFLQIVFARILFN